MDINKQLSEESRDNKKIQSFIMKTCLRFACAFRSISLKFFLETMFFFWWTVTLKELVFVNKVRLFFFFSSNTVLFNVSSKTLDSCFKNFFFYFSNLLNLKFPFEASLLWNCCISFFANAAMYLECADRELFNISLVNGIWKIGDVITNKHLTEERRLLHAFN